MPTIALLRDDVPPPKRRRLGHVDSRTSVLAGRMATVDGALRRHVRADAESRRSEFQFEPPPPPPPEARGPAREAAFWRTFSWLADHATDKPLPLMHRRIVRGYFLATLPVMYGATFRGAQPELLRRYNVDRINTRCLTSMKRRGGKTQTLCMFVAALASAFPLDVNIYAQKLDQSQKVLETIRQFADAYARAYRGQPMRARNDSKRELFVHPVHTETSEVSRITAYSSSGKIGRSDQVSWVPPPHPGPLGRVAFSGSCR